MTGRLITSVKLAQLLRFALSTLRCWNNIPEALHSFIQLGEPPTNHYLWSDVDEFLAGRPHNFAQAPTLTQLFNGDVRLLTREETALLTGIPENRLFYYVGQEALKAVKVMQEWRYDKTSVLEYVRARHNPDYVSLLQAAHILGVSRGEVYRREKEGRLKGVKEKGFPLRVTLDSVIENARSLLPDWIDPLIWVAARQESEHPCLPLNATTRIISESDDGVTALLAAQRLMHIRTPGKRGEYRVSPDSIMQYLESLFATQEPLSAAALGGVYGVRRRTADYWRQWGYVDCTVALHPHAADTLYPVCVRAMLRDNLSPGLEWDHWWERRQYDRGDNPTVGVSSLAKQTNCDAKLFVAAAEAGVIKGVRTPSGRWRFEAPQANLARQLAVAGAL